MRKIFNYLIVFLIFIGIGLVDVNARSFDCECTSIDPDHHFSLTFHVDSNDLVAKFFYPSYVFGGNGGSLYNTTLSSCADTPGRCDYNNKYNYKILNFNTPSDGYTYKDSDYIVNQSCPTYVIYTRESGAKNSEHLSHHFYVSNEASKTKVIEFANNKHKVSGKKATSYLGKCVMKNLKDDPVVSNSNEPSNEPTDPNSNIPTVNSNKTLNDDNTIYFCGSKYADDAVMRNIPADVPRIIRFLYIFLQVLVPIGIVIVSSIDLFKAISAQKEDDIKKGQQTLIKRIVAAVIIFFVFAIVKLVLSVISDNSDSIIDCISCFLENSDEYCIKHVQ